MVETKYPLDSLSPEEDNERLEKLTFERRVEDRLRSFILPILIEFGFSLETIAKYRWESDKMKVECIRAARSYRTDLDRCKQRICRLEQQQAKDAQTVMRFAEKVTDALSLKQEIKTP